MKKPVIQRRRVIYVSDAAWMRLRLAAKYQRVSISEMIRTLIEGLDGDQRD